MLEGSFFADSGAMVAIYVLLGLACADQRFFMPLPEPKLPVQQMRWQPSQRTPVAYMHHGLPHEHAGYATGEARENFGPIGGAAFAPMPAMPLAWQLVPAALLVGVGLYAARFALA